MIKTLDEQAALVFPTQLGWISVSLSGDTVCELQFGHPSPRAALNALSTAISVLDDAPASCLSLQERLEDYAAGNQVDFSSIEVDERHMTEFQKRVVRACREIPYGEAISYGELAARAGSPNAARAVGNIMSTNRVALIVPCHRVIGAHGTLGGYSGADGIRTKQRLLKLEGIVLP